MPGKKSKPVVCLLLVTLLTTSFKQQHKSPGMGMSYDIIPNKKTACTNQFPGGLSFFFEQVGGYGEHAEVEQVSRILKIDLSIFQDIDYNYEDSSDVERHWHNIDTIANVIDSFISKISSNPYYYTHVKHNPNRAKQLDEEEKLMHLIDTAQLNSRLEQLRNQPLYYYPPDLGFLSNRRLSKDLSTLKTILNCFKKDGVTKVRFEYS